MRRKDFLKDYLINNIMFKPIKYRAVFRTRDGIVSEPVSEMTFNSMGVQSVVIKRKVGVVDPATDEIMQEEQDVVIPIDWIETFLQEFTSKYDKVGREINSGDIIKITVKGIAPEDVTLPVPEEVTHYVIQFNDGAFVATNELRQEVMSLTEEFCLMAEKVGTIYQNSDLVDTPIDESIFTPKEDGQETEE
jgi:hypothetical protein